MNETPIADQAGQFLLVAAAAVVAVLALSGLLYLVARFLILAPPTPLERCYTALRIAGQAVLRRERNTWYGRHTPEAIRLAAQAST